MRREEEKNELQLCNNRFFVSLNMLYAIFIMKIIKVFIVMGSAVFGCDNKNNNNNASEAFHDDKKRTKN